MSTTSGGGQTGTEESYLAWVGLCFFPVIVVINIVEELGK